MTATHSQIWSIVVAAGAGSRFGSETPKQFLSVAGRSVLGWSLQAAASVSDGLVVVLPATGEFSALVTVDTPSHVVPTLVAGGVSRSESVRNGLAAVPSAAGVILVHDAARPVASAELFTRVVSAVRAGAKAVVPAVAVVDTVRHIDGEPVNREKLQAVQTPQGFDAQALRDAHAAGADASDDATLVAGAGGKVETVAGERWNVKITEPDDLLVVAALLEDRR